MHKLNTKRRMMDALLLQCFVSCAKSHSLSFLPFSPQAISWDPAILEQKRFIKAQGPEITYDVLQVMRARGQGDGGGTERMGDYAP